MKRIRLLVVNKRERGAVAMVIAMCMVLLMAAAALGMDIAKLAYERQALRAAVDAAAQAGSYALPISATAINDAKSFLVKSAPDLGLDPNQLDWKLFCTVGVKLGTTSPDENQVPSICNPGAAWSPGQAATACNAEVCLLPCNELSPKCNTIRVSYTKIVDFTFGPAIGVPTGTTGAISSASCKGSCGPGAPNPLNVVVVADRTSSMTQTNVNTMKTGLTQMLKTMTPDQQYVALGTIHKGPGTGACQTAAQTTPLADSFALTDPSNRTYQGSWMATPFSSSYMDKDVNGNWVYDASDTLSSNVTCLERDKGIYGTHLAAAMKGAARYLLGYGTGVAQPDTGTKKVYDPKNNLASLANRDYLEVPVRNVIVFETDGEPNEQFTSEPGALTLAGNVYDVSSSSDKPACTNLVEIARKAKQAGVLVITIATGNAAAADNWCYWDSSTDRKTTKAILAEAASEARPGVPSTAGACGGGNAAIENADLDNFFCASDGNELSTVFSAALGSLNKGTRFIKVPTISD